MLLQYSLPKIQSLQPSIQPLASRLLELAAERGVPARIVQGVRSIDEQNVLYTSGAGVTKAPGGLSYHNYGLAFDVVPDDYVSLPDWNPKGDKWAVLGSIGESLGLAWGGRWSKPDLPHFELNAVPVRELKAYWDQFKQIMPVSLTPSAAGGAVILAIAGVWFYWLGPELKRQGLI